MPIHQTTSEDDTLSLAARIAASARPRDVFLLQGPLGAGKSVFARGFIRALCGADTEVPSPTFTLLQTYDGPGASIYHFDLYRLKDPDEIFEIGWEEARSDGIALVEWPERLGPHKPKKARTIRIEPGAGDSRRIMIDE